jgi:hypothetical protein
MSKTIVLHSDDDSVKNASYTIYGYRDRRAAKQFLPSPDEPQSFEIEVPWGGTLMGQRGDYIVSSADDPTDSWPVERDIFEKSHEEEEPGSGIFKKTASVAMIPLTEFTNGDPDQMVTIISLEGAETVSAGKYHLARGIKNEIWAYPSHKIIENLVELK